MPVGSDPEAHKVLSKLGQIAVEWNNVDALMRLLFSFFIGGGDKTDIVTAHLNSPVFINMMKTFTTEYAPKDVQGHFAHLYEFYDRMREYRNYYIHGIINIAYQEDRPIGFAQSHSAKGRLVLHQESIDLTKLQKCLDRLNSLRGFLNRFLDEFLWGGNKTHLIGYQPLSSIEMPPLPDKLQKPRLFLLGEAILPPPSEA
jgi:hypothetical protein